MDDTKSEYLLAKEYKRELDQWLKSAEEEIEAVHFATDAVEAIKHLMLTSYLDHVRRALDSARDTAEKSHYKALRKANAFAVSGIIPGSSAEVVTTDKILTSLERMGVDTKVQYGTD